MNPKDFHYHLPQKLIAHQPVSPRDHSKLLIVDRNQKDLKSRYFYQIPDILTSNDVLVFNQSQVFPARLIGQKSTGGKAEILLLERLSSHQWLAIGKPHLKINQKIDFCNNLSGIITNQQKDHTLTIQFESNQDPESIINTIGQIPIPPYIHTLLSNQQLKIKYQTVYAKEIGSSAAPTAGLHFTKQLIKKIKQKNIQLEYLTLHVGLGTFKPVTKEQINSQTLHSEKYTLTKETAHNLNLAKQQHKRIIAVGTTTTRVLETCTNQSHQLIPSSSSTNIFIKPPYKFKFTDALITNFHLPESSLLMLVSAFTSYPNSSHHFQSFSQSFTQTIYHHAIKNHYRFFSFGDAMFIF